jgi:hypothetical protein
MRSAMSAFGPNRKSRDVRVESETRAITDIQIINTGGVVAGDGDG